MPAIRKSHVEDRTYLLNSSARLLSPGAGTAAGRGVVVVHADDDEAHPAPGSVPGCGNGSTILDAVQGEFHRPGSVRRLNLSGGPCFLR